MPAATERAPQKPPPPLGPLPAVRWAIPQELRNHHAWACWRYEYEHQRWSKPPYNPVTGERAEGGEPSTWSSFDQCYEAYQNRESPRGGGRPYDGVSFALDIRWGIVGVDLDHLSEHNFDTYRIVKLLDSYTEVSPSGDGLHVWVKGALPEGRRRRGFIELYSRRRFLSVTGQVTEGAPQRIQSRPAALYRVWNAFVQHEPSRRETVT
jgi:putative DNA primase/helicase